MDVQLAVCLISSLLCCVLWDGIFMKIHVRTALSK